MCVCVLYRTNNPGLMEIKQWIIILSLTDFPMYLFNFSLLPNYHFNFYSNSDICVKCIQIFFFIVIWNWGGVIFGEWGRGASRWRQNLEAGGSVEAKPLLIRSFVKILSKTFRWLPTHSLSFLSFLFFFHKGSSLSSLLLCLCALKKPHLKSAGSLCWSWAWTLSLHIKDKEKELEKVREKKSGKERMKRKTKIWWRN